MDHKESQESVKDYLLFIFSFMLPLVGLILGIVYWAKKERQLAKQCLLAACVAMVMDIILALIFH